MTTLIEILGVGALLILFIKTSITFSDMGLSADRFRISARATLYRVPVQLAVFCLAKVILMKIKPDFFPSNVPFWDWSQADARLINYLCTSLLQEFLSRGGIQEALSRILPESSDPMQPFF